MTQGERTASRYSSDRARFAVALLGTIVVMLLLTWPIRIGPGDHEKNRICGNAWRVDASGWRNNLDGNYFDLAFRSCNAQRIDRITKAVGVVSVTVLIVTILGLRARRTAADDSAQRPSTAPPQS